MLHWLVSISAQHGFIMDSCHSQQVLISHLFKASNLCVCLPCTITLVTRAMYKWHWKIIRDTDATVNSELEMYPLRRTRLTPAQADLTGTSKHPATSLQYRIPQRLLCWTQVTERTLRRKNSTAGKSGKCWIKPCTHSITYLCNRSSEKPRREDGNKTCL